MIAPGAFMKSIPAWLLGVTLALTAVPGAQVGEPIDTTAIERIRDEGFNRSELRDTMFWLTDRYGPRLQGSPEHEEAGDWVIERLRSWGVQNVRKERFATGRGWTLTSFHATMTGPRVMPIIGLPMAWTPGTNGTVRAELVYPRITNAAEAEAWRGRLRGRIVLTQPEREVRMLEHGDGFVARYDDQDGRWRREAMTPPEPPRPAQGVSGPGRGANPPPEAGSQQPAVRNQQPFDLLSFYRSEGVVALFGYGAETDMAQGGSDLSWRFQRPDGGTIFVQSGATPYADPDAGLPRVTLAVEHYNRMLRLVERGVAVTVELEIGVRFREEDPASPNGFNVIGEIPGTDRADEVVLIGAHLDSWHAATGATDNASGVATMMEVLRIFRATGLQPRRTVRIGLWGSEETGLHGSAHYAAQYLGTLDRPRPELDRMSAYFNLDNGTGPIRGVWMQGNSGVAPIFQAWASALPDLGVDLLSPRPVRSTDHVPFHQLGIPAFQFVQERYEYTSRTHHSNMDYLDRVQFDALEQNAVITAVFVWHAANREELLPRQ
jgi:carboxypeptidase Q